MKSKLQQNGLVVFRAALIIKSVAILGMLLVALLLQDSRAQEAALWPTLIVLLMLVVFGTSWFESRLGGRFFPLALGVAVLFQTIELGLHHPAIPAAGPLFDPWTQFGAIEPFLFLLVPVALAAWRYGSRGAFLAAGGAAVLYVTIVLLSGNAAQTSLVTMLTQLSILVIVAGVVVLISAHDPHRDVPAVTAHAESTPEPIPGRDTRETLLTLLAGLDARMEALYDQFDDAPDDVRHELAQLKLTTADALSVIAAPRRSGPFCSRSLIEALHEYVDGFRQRTGVAVALQLKLEPDSLQPAQAETAFKIVEEALDGVASHACAQASVSLLCSDSHVALSVHGASPSVSLTDDTGLASEVRLLSLHRRAESVGGILCVSQQPQQGTTVACVFPRSTTHA